MPHRTPHTGHTISRTLLDLVTLNTCDALALDRARFFQFKRARNPPPKSWYALYHLFPLPWPRPLMALNLRQRGAELPPRPDLEFIDRAD